MPWSQEVKLSPYPVIITTPTPTKQVVIESAFWEQKIKVIRYGNRQESIATDSREHRTKVDDGQTPTVEL